MNKLILCLPLSSLLWLLSSSTHAGLPQHLSKKAQLGKSLFNDTNLSLMRNQSCASCHSLKSAKSLSRDLNFHAPGFVDPDNVLTGSAVSDGSVKGEFGALNAASVGYAAFSPFFHWDGSEGLYIGGQFWNGRAATLQEQAKMPFLSPQEMAMPNKWAVVSRLKENRKYVKAFKRIYGIDLNAIPFKKRWHFRQNTPPGVGETYEAIANAIAAFEKSRFFNRFTSKFDYYLAGQTELSPLEKQGLDLFEGKALCSACHVSEAAIAPDGSIFPPLFTDFTYDNIGAPRNVNIPGNPEPDLGLGGRADIAERDPDGNELGKHKVMSLRNIEITPPYAHNGVFKTLEAIVHFYNTRDVLGSVADNNDPGFGVTGWPAPEISENVNTDELGNLMLSTEEEVALVAFLKTLTDGYQEWGNDPNVPKETPSPFADTTFPPLP